MSTTADDLREEVRRRYAESARAVTEGSGGCGCGSGECCAEAGDDAASFVEAFYDAEQRGELPEAAVLASLGCGNPIAVAELHEGEVVLDLGSGGGIDVILSARRVGPTGTAYGLDMTDEMLALAQRNARDAGVTNVHFLKGVIEQIPLPADSVDVVISNCVINLSVDKSAVLTEIARVLKPGGRVGVSDIVAEDHVTAEQRGRARQLRRLHRRRPLEERIHRRARGRRLRGRRGRVHARGRGRDARRNRQGGEDDRAGAERAAGDPARSEGGLLLTAVGAADPDRRPAAGALVRCAALRPRAHQLRDAERRVNRGNYARAVSATLQIQPRLSGRDRPTGRRPKKIDLETQLHADNGITLNCQDGSWRSSAAPGRPRRSAPARTRS